jgi:hypothetical protein
MTTTTTTSVDSTIMSEILAQTDLAPLRSRFALLGFLNTSSIDGAGTGTRSIPKRNAIADAIEDDEGVDFTTYEELTYDSPVQVTPVSYAQGVKLTMDALRKAMPGRTRAQCIEALRAMRPEMIPVLGAAAVELLQSHYRVAEGAALDLLPGLASSAGSTNTALDFLSLIDGQTTLLDNKPEHRTLACFVDNKGIGDLRADMINGDAAASALFGNGYGEEFLAALGSPPSDALRPFGNILGMPIIEVDADLMARANADVDLVGGIVCVGRGETGASNSLRGFAEFCEGYALAMDIAYDLESDAGKAIGRYNWGVAEHTDEHGVQLIYKRT